MERDSSACRKRYERLVRLLSKSDIYAAVFVPGPNFTYLTGVSLHLMERLTLFAVTRGSEKYAVMPAIERQKWGSETPDVETFYWDDLTGPGKALERFASAIGTDAVLGVEGLRMRAAEYLALLEYWPERSLVNSDTALTELRILKDDEEVSELRQAIKISETAFCEVLDGGIKGRTEMEVSRRLRSALLAHGATDFAFDPIVLTGAEASNPHGDAGDRVVKPGQILLIDFGASYGNMHADITRSVFCEYASDEHAELYETVRAANEAGRNAARPGSFVGDVDAAATDVLANSRFADLILHKTGHGLGREVHELPQVVRTNRMVLEPGMVFTVEPGLYRENDIGVRIEDDVLITKNGHESLTSLPRELLIYA